MNETISVRDQTQPCEHGSLWHHWVEIRTARWWQEPDRLGGREMILRRLDDGEWAEVEPDRVNEGND